MIPVIFVFKIKINVCSESKKYYETFESRKLSHNKIMYSSSQ